MEKISFYIRSSKKKNLKVNYRLRDGRDIQIFHRSDIHADLADLNKFNPKVTFPQTGQGTKEGRDENKI